MSEIRLEGLEEIFEKIDGMTDINKINRALGRSCALVEAAAKQKAPKGNGILRGSITSKVENGVGTIFTPLEYAPYVEYGTGLFAEKGGRTDVPWSYQDDEGEWHSTSGMHPQPFMRPALDENRQKIIEILKEGILND